MHVSHYNPWPLGKLPDSWQRPEPEAIRALGYNWDDPRDIVGMFERRLADYAGAKYAVVTDSCSNAIFLALKYRALSPGSTIEIPDQTYVSVPQQIHFAGYIPQVRDQKWSGLYELEGSGVFDSAARFRPNMFVGGEALQCLSFQIKKRLPIGRGGAILTDSHVAASWLKIASYDGRDLESPYDSDNHVRMLGWHYYMTPEDAARGLLLMEGLDGDLPDTMDQDHYPKLSEMVGLRSILRVS